MFWCDAIRNDNKDYSADKSFISTLVKHLTPTAFMRCMSTMIFKRKAIMKQIQLVWIELNGMVLCLPFS